MYFKFKIDQIHLEFKKAFQPNSMVNLEVAINTHKMRDPNRYVEPIVIINFLNCLCLNSSAY